MVSVNFLFEPNVWFNIGITKPTKLQVIYSSTSDTCRTLFITTGPDCIVDIITLKQRNFEWCLIQFRSCTWNRFIRKTGIDSAKQYKVMHPFFVVKQCIIYTTSTKQENFTINGKRIIFYFISTHKIKFQIKHAVSFLVIYNKKFIYKIKIINSVANVKIKYMQ